MGQNGLSCVCGESSPFGDKPVFIMAMHVGFMEIAYYSSSSRVTFGNNGIVFICTRYLQEWKITCHFAFCFVLVSR